MRCLKERCRCLLGGLDSNNQNFRWLQCFQNCRKSKRWIVFVVFIAIYIDTTLMTVVVPIVPSYLFSKEHPQEFLRLKYKDNSPGYRNVCVDANISTASLLPDGLFYNITELNTTQPGCHIELVSPEEMRHKAEREIREQSGRVGLLFGSKNTLQFLVNPFVGVLTNRIGFSIPMFAGFVTLIASILVFAFGTNYWVLLAARSVEGIGSSCSSVAGMGLIAKNYRDDAERGAALAIALSGLALGVVSGPPFGGIMYEYFGKPSAFIALAGFALFDGILQLFVLRPRYKPEHQEGTSLLKLVRDPYILIAAGSVGIANCGFGMVEALLPNYMLDTMNAKSLDIGLVYLSSSVAYLVGTLVVGPCSHRFGRWLSGLLGNLAIAFTLIATSFCTSILHLIAPLFLSGFGLSMVDSSMMPTLGYLVDIRHISVYGSVYAIGDAAFCLGFAIGPAAGGLIEKYLGFKWALYIMAILNFSFSPLLYFLRNPPGNEEKKKLLASGSLKKYKDDSPSNSDTEDLLSPSEK